ncbi:PKD1L2 [Mytilus coruscus]|uniref:PKD1L2 n=1 Tax=Mytilus coruscus TaxID=42192 RepID=A0A6J8CDD8_MYTCO|nr:PKD1L2 [Mytilus coruscus]
MIYVQLILWNIITVTTTENPCAVYDCQYGASCNADGDCICQAGFTSDKCTESSLEDLYSAISQSPLTNISDAETYAKQTHRYMDSHITQTYTDLKTSVLTTNDIFSSLMAKLTNSPEFSDEETVDLSDFSQDMAELFSDVLKGTRQTQNTLAAEDELMSIINTAEDNMIEMVNMVLDKRTSDENPKPVAITTTEVSVLAIKAKGGKLPEHFLTEIGGLSLPFFETFQDRSRKKEIVIIVFAYKRSPYLYVTNPESIGNGSSVVKVVILEKEKEKEKDILKIEDEDDPLEVSLSNEKLELANELVSMTESSTDSGIFMSYVDTKITANEFLIEIKLKSLKMYDRHDSDTRKKRSISLVTHKFRTSHVSSSTLFKTFENWTANERKEDLRTSDNQIKFKSNFLGAFSADVFFIPPSDIDFSKIFATFTTSLVDSPYALAAIITMLVIGSFLTIKLRWLDISDKIMWEFLPLKDNPYDFSVVYFVTIETSVNSSREMKSSVFLNIIGQNGFSGTRKMDDGIRKNFKNGTTSHFTMKLEEDVGNIKKIQIWHDNTDANTLQRYTFLCGRILSLKSENGRIWSSLNVFNEDVVETDTLFYNISRRKLFDDYLWVSLVKRPQFSRFTRVQRLWCLTTILFLSMVSSAMWYDIPDVETTQSIILGPLRLNFKQFYVGLMSGLVALIPSIVLVLIFRKRKFQGEVCQGCYIPWWFIFIAYTLIVLCVVISGTFVFLYSLQWGGDKTLEWMISFLLSVCQSVLILEPLKAIIIAAVIACVFKRVGSKELCDLSTPIPSGDNFSNANSGQDVHMEGRTKNDHNRAKYPLFPGNQNETKEQMLFRKTVQLDKRLWTKIRTWIGIFLYVTLIAAICSHNDVSSAYLQNEHILNTLSTINTPNSSSEISDYIKTTFSRAVYPKWWETENDELLRPAYIQRFLLNAYNYRLTLTRFRQLRVKGNCTGPAITQDTIRRCVPSYSEETEETANFCPFWGDFNESDCFDENEEFHYSFLNSRFDDLDPAGDLIYFGEHGTYGPGGYYIDLGPKQSLVSKYLDELIEHDWIDYRTRVLFLDLVTYNANSRLFSQIKLVFELPTTGSITLTKHVWSASFYPYQSSLDFVVLVLQIIFVLVWCVRFVLFLVFLIRCRMNAFLIVHTYSKLLELFFGAVAIICYILRIDATISVITSLRESVGRYISFEKVYQFDAAYQGSLAMLLFIIILDLLSPLEFNYHFFTMVSSLKIARGAIVAFMVIIILELTAFASLIWLTIGRKDEMFKNMFETMNTLLTVLLSMRKYNTEAFDDLLVKFYFGLYTFSLTKTLVNVFISLLTISLNDVKCDLDKGVLQFDQDLNKHLWVKVNKFIQWIKDKLCFPEMKEKEDDKLKICGSVLVDILNLSEFSATSFNAVMTKQDIEDWEIHAACNTRQGPSTTILNVDIDAEIQTRSEIHLPLSDVKGTDGDHSHLAHYIIVGRESSDKEWEKINSTLKTTDNGFRFAFNKPWSVFEVTVKESKIHWIQKYRHNSYFDIPLVKAIVIISQIKEVAIKWKQIANLLGIVDTDMFTSEVEILCQEEKCFIVLEKWLQQSTVTFRMLISLLCSLNLKAIADQIEQKWQTDIFPEQYKSNDNDNGTVLANPDKDVTGNQRMKEFIYLNN